MKHIKLLNEYIGNPKNVEWESNRMLVELEKLLNDAGCQMTKRIEKYIDHQISIYVKNPEIKDPKIIHKQLKSKLENFFDKWQEQFIKTNTSLAVRYDDYSEFSIKLHLKDIKTEKYRYTKGQGQTLFHFASAEWRQVILEKGIQATKNERSEYVFGIELAHNEPVVFAMPSFDTTGKDTYQMTGKIFKLEIFPTTVFTNFTLKNNKTGEIRECTIVPNKNYSMNTTDRAYKIMTPWSIIVDATWNNSTRAWEYDSSSNVTKQFMLDERKYSVEIGLYSRVNLDESCFYDNTKSGTSGVEIQKFDDFSEQSSMNEWIILRKGYTLDLWEIDLDKINHTWWSDPASNQPGYLARKDIKQGDKWLISYDGSIPTNAIKIKESYIHGTL